jgi:guanylate kinase
MDRSQFEALIGTGEFLEHAEYVGNLYGTPRSPAVKLLGAGVSVILDIEVQGAAMVKVSMPESVSVFLMPPSLKELERRLRSRGTESDDRISRRLVTARDEFARAGSYDYIVINGDSDKAAAELSAIVSAEKCRAPRRLPILEEALRSV